MQPESQPAPRVREDAARSGDASYWKRMLLIQRWRRIAWLVCLFLALWALLFSLLDPGFQQPSTIMLVKSMLAFIVAVLAAVNLLTFQLRK
jgi:uncharacterized membrane protein